MGISLDIDIPKGLTGPSQYLKSMFCFTELECFRSPSHPVCPCDAIVALLQASFARARILQATLPQHIPPSPTSSTPLAYPPLLLHFCCIASTLPIGPIKAEYVDKDQYVTMLNKALKEWSDLVNKLSASNAAMRSMYESGVALQ